MFENKTLLITGGTGSFGGVVLKRFIDSPLKEIRIYSRDEKKQDDLRKVYSNSKIKFYVGDVRDYNSVDNAVKGVDYIFHAAALKQVPSCEFFPMEAVKTNILGTENVLDAAIKYSVKKVLVLSTDKAVYPINAMGLSKAMMEKVMVAKSRTIEDGGSPIICGTRYGNVMASRGSVIPLFIEQMKAKKPITITDPSMTRFMMTLEDALDLVIFAFENGMQGDIFVQKSPACTVDVLAKALKAIYNSSSDIKYIGTRHGEKLFETLVNREEMVKAENLTQYYRIPADHRDLNYKTFEDEGQSTLNSVLEYNSSNTDILTVETATELLLKLEEIKADLKAI